MAKPPALQGLHHVKLPVSDLDAAIEWYHRVLGATHQAQFDHHDSDGARYSVIMALPGSDVPLELRWAPQAASHMAGYDPISFVVTDASELTSWAQFLDTQQVAHSPVTEAAAGHLLVLADPDGTYLRLLELPKGGMPPIDAVPGDPEPDGTWFSPPAMSHPRPSEAGR